jgi:hypothetical protein
MCILPATHRRNPVNVYRLVVASCVALSLLGCAGLGKAEKWEYKVVYVMNEGHDRTNDGAMKFTSVSPSEADFDGLGAEGWELATSYLEVETAYPNFGNSGYVTGLQPNVRPQRVVFVFKRPATEE